MPAKQTIVEPVKTKGGLGPINGGSTVSTALMEECFPGSPIYDGTLTDEERTEFYENRVLHAEVNDGGHTFGTFSTDFSLNDAPNLNDVETGGGGLPASPWVPNPTSAPDVDPTQQPDPPEDFGKTPNDTPFNGVGSQANPSQTTKAISDTKLGDYLMSNNGQPLYPG